MSLVNVYHCVLVVMATSCTTLHACAITHSTLAANENDVFSGTFAPMASLVLTEARLAVCLPHLGNSFLKQHDWTVLSLDAVHCVKIVSPSEVWCFHTEPRPQFPGVMPVFLSGIPELLVRPFCMKHVSGEQSLCMVSCCIFCLYTFLHVPWLHSMEIRKFLTRNSACLSCFRRILFVISSYLGSQ